MKKKTIGLLMATILLSSLVGCGNLGESTEPQSVVEEETVDETKQDKAEAEDTSDTADSSESEAATSDKNSPFLNVETTSVDLNASDEESGRYYIVEVDYTKVALSEEDAKQYPELAQTLDDYNSTVDSAKDSELADLKERYMEFEMDSDDEDYVTYNSSDLSHVLRADKHVLSLLKNNYSYQGGAHGYYMVYGEAYDVESGKILSVSDVVKDEATFIGRIKDRLIENYPDTGFMVDLDEYFDSVTKGEYELYWSIDYSGITVYFEPYDIASYADGILKVRFSFEEDGDLINEKYMSVPDDYITPVTTWTEAYADLDADGSEDPILLIGTAPEEDWDANKWEWSIGDTSISDTIESYGNESYLVKKDGKYYAYMFNSVENDYKVLSVIDLATGKELGGEFGMSNMGLYDKDFGYDEDGASWRTSSAFVNPNSFELDSRMDVLGTYSGIKEYHVASNGKPESDDDFYRVDRMGYLIKPLRDLPCQIIDRDGNVLEENATLPKDTMLRIVRTDGETIADLQAGDYAIEDNDYGDDDYITWYTSDPIDLDKGTFYRIQYEIKDYEKILDGDSIFDVFKGMMFAG